ncbi:DNA (cytosine-5-)-methyltransferase [Patescibacteria group bacterium]|nr:DNA (cytosine-5-)-methyltransferase [Patescibacteria group bacterium]
MSGYRYIDLFAGAGGLSEGFIRQGFSPIAHVEYDKASCFTLETRAAFHHLLNEDKIGIYHSYIKGKISRSELYSHIPQSLLNSIINAEIGQENEIIFDTIGSLLNGRSVDLIIGGPPCQAYSRTGRPALKHKTNDERTTLYIQYGRFLNKYKPGLFVFENVPGILSVSEGKYFINLQKYFKRLGYQVEARLLNAYNCGVIQNRKRVIIIGWQKELGLSYPEINSFGEKYFRDDIFYDLPSIKPGENNRYHYYSKPVNEYLKKAFIRNDVNFVSQHITRAHNEKDLNIYKLAIQKLMNGERLKNNRIPEGMRTQQNITDFLDRFKVVGNEPHTMIAHIAKDGHHFIHPDINQLRSISVREAARVQSFPDDYYFESIKEKNPRTAAFRQIGNAVPPLMAERIAAKIKEMLDNEH